MCHKLVYDLQATILTNDVTLQPSFHHAIALNDLISMKMYKRFRTTFSMIAAGSKRVWLTGENTLIPHDEAKSCKQQREGVC